jgi:acyl carrier protein
MVVEELMDLIPPVVDARGIESVILAAIDIVNQSRLPDEQLAAHPAAPIFGDGSRLDSLGLVSLLIEVEDQLALRGWPVSLSDERAMSQKRSPFRDVPSLVGYIQSLAVPQS